MVLNVIEGVLAFLAMRHLSVLAVKRDARHGHLMHIFLEETMTPKGRPSRTAFRHLLLDMRSLRTCVGQRQNGERLQMDSPFVARSLERAGVWAGQSLALGKQAGNDGVKVLHKHVEEYGDVLEKHGRVLSVQTKTVEGNSETSDREVSLLRLCVDGTVLWSMKTDGSAGVDRCFTDQGDRLFCIYSGLADTVLLVLDMRTGEELSKRYLLRILP